MKRRGVMNWGALENLPKPLERCNNVTKEFTHNFPHTISNDYWWTVMILMAYIRDLRMDEFIDVFRMGHLIIALGLLSPT